MRLSMKVMAWGTITFLIAAAETCASQQRSHALIAHEIQSCPGAFRSLVQGNMREIYQQTKGRRCPRLTKLAQWWGLKEGSPAFTFSDYADFVARHPNWPHMHAIKLNAEYALNARVPARTILKWFKTQPPQTVHGSRYYIEALHSTKQPLRAIQAIRFTWVNLNFGKSEEKDFYSQFKAYLRPIDHFERTDRLLGQERIEQVQRMLTYLKADERRWAQTRLALLKDNPDVKLLLAALPMRLRSDPGLLYDRLKRLRKLELDEAFPLFLAIAKREKDKNLWWTERKTLARRALNQGRADLAYKIMVGHGFKEGEEFADAEWFMGWLALSFLHKPQTAIRHFESFYRIARTPLSRAKAAYWAGRAWEHLQRIQQARIWYQRGSHSVTSYYGQLSLQKLKGGRPSALPQRVQLSAKQQSIFEAQEIPQIVHLLGAARAERLILEFAYVYAKKASSFTDRYLMVDLVHHVAPHYVVAVAKQAERVSPMLVEKAYPILKSLNLSGGGAVEPAFAHAVIRQESDFNPKAISGAGAQGLMQLMPETAKMVATKLSIPYQSHALRSDPLYNLKLGMEYLADRLRRYEGSYVLALASYNAGSGRVQEWLKIYGDPRLPGVDLVQWIETLPYVETRTYIQRIMANLYIYRSIFKGRF